MYSSVADCRDHQVSIFLHPKHSQREISIVGFHTVVSLDFEVFIQRYLQIFLNFKEYLFTFQSFHLLSIVHTTGNIQ